MLPKELATRRDAACDSTSAIRAFLRVQRQQPVERVVVLDQDLEKSLVSGRIGAVVQIASRSVHRHPVAGLRDDFAPPPPRS